MSHAIAKHFNILESAIVRIEEWANVLFVVVRGVGARFVSKKIAKMEKQSLFGYNFLPNPKYIEDFQNQVKQRFFKQPYNQKFLSLFLDTLNLIRNELMSKKDWTQAEKEAVLSNYLTLSIWDDCDQFHGFKNALEVVEAIELALTRNEGLEKIQSAMVANLKKPQNDYKASLAVQHRNSYKAKEEIKKLGGKWDAVSKIWIMPNRKAYDKAIEACEQIKN